MTRQSRCQVLFARGPTLAPAALPVQRQSRAKRPLCSAAPCRLTPCAGAHPTCLTGNAHHRREDKWAFGGRQGAIRPGHQPSVGSWFFSLETPIPFGTSLTMKTSWAGAQSTSVTISSMARIGTNRSVFGAMGEIAPPTSRQYRRSLAGDSPARLRRSSRDGLAQARSRGQRLEPGTYNIEPVNHPNPHQSHPKARERPADRHSPRVSGFGLRSFPIFWSP
jgi:hypothetical protein